MIHDEQLGPVHAAPGSEVETVLIILTLSAETIAAIALDQIPHDRRRTKLQIAQAAVERDARPAADLHQLIVRRLFGEQRHGLLLRNAQPPQAQIITPPFHQRRSQLGQNRLEKWNVFANQLLLQTDRVRGDNHRRVLVFQRVQDGRHEVGEALTDAGTGFDHQMLLIADRAGDGRRHRHLLRPALEIRQPLSDLTAVTENLVDGHAI